MCVQRSWFIPELDVCRTATGMPGSRLTAEIRWNRCAEWAEVTAVFGLLELGIAIRGRRCAQGVGGWARVKAAGPDRVFD
jgi:hypothetical protein